MVVLTHPEGIGVPQGSVGPTWSSSVFDLHDRFGLCWRY